MTQQVVFRPEILHSTTYTVPKPPPPPKAHKSPNSIAKGESLTVNDFILSPNKRLAFVLQNDGNLVAYATGPQDNPVALWASHTNGQPIARANFQDDGNFVLVDEYSNPIWATASEGWGGVSINAQDDGNVVMVMADGTPRWDTGSYGFDPRNLHNDRSSWDATTAWLDKAFTTVFGSVHPPHWDWWQAANRWLDENEQAVFTVFAGGVGFIVGGPAGAAAGSALMKSAWAAGQGVEIGKLDAKAVLSFAQAAASASGVDLPSISDIPGAEEVQSAIDDGARSLIDIDTSKLGIDFPGFESQVLPWMNAKALALQLSVARGTTKIVDAAGNLILGMPNAPNAVVAWTQDNIVNRTVPGASTTYWKPDLINSLGPVDTRAATAVHLQNFGVPVPKALGASELAYNTARGMVGSEQYAKGMSNEYDAAVMQAALDVTKRLQVRSAYVKHYLSLGGLPS
jgi:hypothetical protein